MVSMTEHSFELISDIRQVLEELEASHKIEPSIKIGFESPSVDVRGVCVVPAEIESFVAHHPREQAAATAIIEAAGAVRYAQAVGQSERQTPANVVTEHIAGVKGSDHYPWRLSKPVRKLCLDEIAAGAMEIGDLVLAQYSGREEEVGCLATQAAFLRIDLNGRLQAELGHLNCGDN
jgi:hypothetical protein